MCRAISCARCWPADAKRCWAGEIRRLTVFLSDIEGFTAYSESMPPDKLVHELAEYLEIMSGQLRRHSGEIDKFIGDGVLAFFNAPAEVKRHEEQACRATLAALRELDARREKGGPPFRTRVGLHAGDVLVGNLGTADRLAYTVLGDVVNVTSRLEALNKLYGTQILVSGEVRTCAGRSVRLAPHRPRRRRGPPRRNGALRTARRHGRGRQRAAATAR